MNKEGTTELGRKGGRAEERDVETDKERREGKEEFLGAKLQPTGSEWRRRGGRAGGGEESLGRMEAGALSGVSH